MVQLAVVVVEAPASLDSKLRRMSETDERRAPEGRYAGPYPLQRSECPA